MTDALDNEIAHLEGRLEKMKRLLALRLEASNAELGLLMGNTKADDQIKTIVAAICSEYGFKPKMIYVDRRIAKLVEARHLIFYFCRKFTSETYKELGRMFHRDHAAVIHGVRRIESRINNEPKFLRHVFEIEQQCQKQLTNETKPTNTGAE